MFQVYREMPCYSLFFGLTVFHWQDLPVEARKLFWREARSLLSQDDEALTQPLAYSLWCDFFEDREKVGEAWDELVVSRFSGDGVDAAGADTTSGAMHGSPIDNGTANLLRQVLDVSGPVPFELKEELYTRLIVDSSFHQSIFYSLLFSCTNVYGQIDKQKAREWLQKLDLPADTEYLDQLQDCLA